MRVAIALGSNLGEREATLHQGVEVAGLKGVAVLAEQMENVIRRGGHGRIDPTRGPKCRQSEQ